MKVSKKSNFWMFLIGLGAQTQFHVVGSLGISEFPIYLVAPFVFIMDYAKLRRCGFLPWIWLVLCVCVGCMISSYANRTPTIFFLKGFATPYSIFAIGVVFFHFLYDDLLSFKWYLLGAAISGVICVFVFQPETYITSAEGTAQGSEAAASVMSYPLFWARQISSFSRLPIHCCYLSVPSLYSWGVPILSGLVAILFSDSSGRAAFITSTCGALIILVGGRTRKSIRELGRCFVTFCVCGIMAIILLKMGYSSAANSGMLGEKAQEKYERQTATGRGVLNLLMAGRKEFFVSLIAAKDKPILGHGPKAEDTEGYMERFLRKYGSKEDFENYMRDLAAVIRLHRVVYRVIPTHSHVGSFWVYYGIAGLLYWLYVLWLIWKYFRCYAHAIPQYFGYLALSFSGMLWSIFFNPYGFRFGGVLPIVLALFAKAVFEGKIILSPQMVEEIVKVERGGALSRRRVTIECVS